MNDRDVMVPLDFSSASLQAIDVAEELTGSGKICLVHVIEDDFVRRAEEAGFGTAEQVEHRLSENAKQKLDAILAQRADSTRITRVVVRGVPFKEVLRLSRELDFDMIVLAKHGRHRASVESLLFGSTAEKIVRGASIPVLCVPIDLAVEPGSQVQHEEARSPH